MTADKADIEILVEIRRETYRSIGVVPTDSSLPNTVRHQMIWLPRAEIKAIKPEAGQFATLTIPRWLADAERLLPKTEEDANQGTLL